MAVLNGSSVSWNVIVGLGVLALLVIGVGLRYLIPHIIKRNREIEDTEGKWWRDMLGDRRDNEEDE